MSRPHPPTLFLNSHRQTLYAGAVAVTLAVMVLASLYVLHLRQQAQARMVHTTQTLSRSVLQSLDGLVDTVRMALQGSAQMMAWQLAAGRVDAVATTQFLMQQKQSVLPLVFIRATNAQGDVLYGPGVVSPPSNLADRAYFQQLRDEPGRDFVISRPLIGRLDPQLAWIFAYRITLPNGGFGGMVFGRIHLSEVQQMLAQIQPGPGSTLALRGAANELIARHQDGPDEPPPVGDTRLSDSFAAALAQNPQAGHYINDGRTGTLSGRRVHAYARSARHGFLVNVGVDEDLGLADWRQQAWVVAALVLSFATVSWVFTALIGRAWRRQDAAVAALQDQHAQLQTAQRIAHLGHFSYGLYTRRWQGSPMLDELLGIDADFPRDHHHWLSLVDPEDRGRVQDALARLLDGAVEFDQEYRILRPDTGECRWMHGQGQVHADTLGRVDTLVGTLQDITARKAMELQVQQLAFYDPLTQLANRRLLQDRLALALAVGQRSGLWGALMFLDLDHFKPLNDRHGHAVGDLLLIEVARRLRQSVRASDTVARWGGDEFVLLLPELGGDADQTAYQASLVADKLLAALSQPYRLMPADRSQGVIEHQCTASIGVTVYLASQTSADEVLKRADAAMYQVKTSGRHGVQLG